MGKQDLFECGITENPIKRVYDEFIEQVKDECTVAELKTLVSVVHALDVKEIEYYNSIHVPIIGICCGEDMYYCMINTFDYEKLVIVTAGVMERAGLDPNEAYTFKKEDIEWFTKHFQLVTDAELVDDENSVKYVATIRPEFHEDENNE